jgi:hypothetical protein
VSLLKPTAQTPFHIDFEWWKQNENDWRVFLQSLLCAEHQKLLGDAQEGALMDWIDPQTAEVKQVDAIQHALMTHCALQPDFINEHTAMVEAIFRIFLVSGNQPMSANDLSKRLNRPAETILRTLTGPRIYRGLRPYSISKSDDMAEPTAAAAV